MSTVSSSTASPGLAVIFQTVPVMWALTGVAMAFLYAVSGGQAQAHPQFAISTVNRYGKLVLLPGEVRVSYVIMAGDVPALSLRQGADQNHDGRVDAPEARALAQRLREGAAHGISLRVDGRPVTIAFDEPVVTMPDDHVAPAPLAVDLSARVPLLPAPVHELRYDDRDRLDPVGEVVLVIEESPGVRLLQSGQGSADGNQRQLQFNWYGPPPSSITDRSVVLRFAAGARGPAPRRAAPWAAWLGGAACLALLGLCLWWMRKRPA